MQSKKDAKKDAEIGHLFSKLPTYSAVRGRFASLGWSNIKCKIPTAPLPTITCRAVISADAP